MKMPAFSEKDGGVGDAVSLSFEFFPTIRPDLTQKLLNAVAHLNRYHPRFISVTYGAGGSTQSSSLALVDRLNACQESPVAAHLTCVGASRADINGTALRFYQAGSRHIVALRGDPAEGVGHPFIPHRQGYRTSSELVSGLKTLAPFEISVGAYCERHPESPDWQTEINGLRKKVDAGADRALTQFFFGNDLFESYRERVAAAGIDIPIVPGILPIHNIDRVRSFANKCGATVPETVLERFSQFKPGSRDALSAAIDDTAKDIADLRRQGVDQFHFYTMNRSDLIIPILDRLGIDAVSAAKPDQISTGIYGQSM